MSELKAYNVVATADVNPDVVDNLGCTEWPAYDKEEADKVIAEKDKEIRHQKYKRCLGMALVWFERAENSTDWKNELVSRKRFSKWMGLAEKFKETK